MDEQTRRLLGLHPPLEEHLRTVEGRMASWYAAWVRDPGAESYDASALREIVERFVSEVAEWRREKSGLVLARPTLLDGPSRKAI